LRGIWTLKFLRRYTSVMSDSIPAVFDSGVFRPLQPVQLAQGTPAEVIPLDRIESNSRDVWPEAYFEQTAGALAGEDFERPSQGRLPEHEGW